MDQVFTMELVPGLGEHFVQMADNWGLSDEDRAYNFLVARYEPTAQNIAAIHKDYKLVGAPAFSSRLSGNAGRVVRAIFTYRHNGDNNTLEQKYFVRVDVTHEFPFIVTAWHPYLERERRHEDNAEDQRPHGGGISANREATCFLFDGSGQSRGKPKRPRRATGC